MFIRSVTGWRKSRKELSANQWRLSPGFPGHNQDLIRRWAGLNRRIRTWKILSLFRDAISDGLIVGFDGFGSLKFGCGSKPRNLEIRLAIRRDYLVLCVQCGLPQHPKPRRFPIELLSRRARGTGD
jgi:hypothetical protein